MDRLFRTCFLFHQPWPSSSDRKVLYKEKRMSSIDKTQTQPASPRNKSSGIRAQRGGAVRRDSPGSGEVPVAPRERQQLIATAAYFRAQQRGFIPGGELQDWLQAEAEVDRFLLGEQSSGSTPSRNKPGRR
jgi:hypothetical protein